MAERKALKREPEPESAPDQTVQVSARHPAHPDVFTPILCGPSKGLLHYAVMPANTQRGEVSIRVFYVGNVMVGRGEERATGINGGKGRFLLRFMAPYEYRAIIAGDWEDVTDRLLAELGKLTPGV